MRGKNRRLQQHTAPNEPTTDPVMLSTVTKLVMFSNDVMDELLHKQPQRERTDAHSSTPHPYCVGCNCHQ
jgi:hypothetical protein